VPIADTIIADACAAPPSPLLARPELDVELTDVELLDGPARLRYRASVGRLDFGAEITYHSIAAWDRVWAALPEPASAARLAAVLLAWDAMRFLALGGERIVLPDDYPCDEPTAATWRLCFQSQFGEWRFRNRLRYRDAALPRLDARRVPTPPARGAIPPAAPRWLLANGGGKDTLAGTMLLGAAGASFDVYEGYLPIGGRHERQRALLAAFRAAAMPSEARVVAVSVHDDLYDRPEASFARAGVNARFFKTDFAVGHTANYPGYFPLVLAHGYDRVWFNIERSADDADVVWDGAPISHQWCKSRDYQAISRTLLRRVTGCDWFKGFGSTLRGLHDTAIYDLVGRRPDLLRLTHSCNYGKPWCGRCPKCCFCYLMMSALHGERYAMEVTGASVSLLADPANQAIWASLLERDGVAWECVPSHEECLIAVDRCLERGIDHPVLRSHAPGRARAARLRHRYGAIAWEDVPEPLVPALEELTR
jgi:hypothetical protein